MGLLESLWVLVGLRLVARIMDLDLCIVIRLPSFFPDMASGQRIGISEGELSRLGLIEPVPLP